MTPLTKVLAVIVAAVGVAGGGFWAGANYGADRVQAKWDQERAAQANSQVKSLTLGLSHCLGLQYEHRRQAIHYVTQMQIKKIPVYLPDTSGCPVLPRGCGLLYNESVAVADGDPAFAQLDDAGAVALLDREPR